MDQVLPSQEDALSNEELMQLEQEPAGEEESEGTQPVLRPLTTGELSAPSDILRLAYRSLPVAAQSMMSGN